MKKNKIIFAIVLCITFISMVIVLPKIFFENDTFYTIKVGESIVKHGLDMVDHFSWIPNLSYTYPHWLFDIPIYLVHNAFGNLGIHVFVVICFLSLLFLMYYCCKKISGNNYISFLITLLLGMTLSSYATARAQIISYPLFLLILYFINRLRETGNKKYMIGMFISSLIVANVHSAVWPIILILFLPYVVSDIIYLITKKFKYEVSEHFNIEVEKSHLKITLIALLVCFVTGFMTPNFLVPFSYYINIHRGISLSHISEHLPLTISGHPHVFILLLLTVIILLHKKRKLLLSDLFLLCGLFLLSFLSRRSYFLLSILGCIPVARMLKDITFSYIEAVFDNIVFRSILIGLMISIAIVGYNFKKERKFITDQYPVEVSKYIKENLDVDNIRLFNEYNYGSYVILEDIKVFVDSRSDLYMPEFNRDVYIFKDFINIGSNYEAIFKKYDITHVLLSNDHGVNNYLKFDKNYKVIYKDDHFTLYEVLKA